MLGPLRDIWTVAAADLTSLTPLIKEGDQKFDGLYNTVIKQNPGLSAAQLNAKLNQLNFWAFRDRAVVEIADEYLKHPYPVQFLLIVSPMVTWLWAGAIIIVIGGLTSLIPAGVFARRRKPAVERSRVAARELV